MLFTILAFIVTWQSKLGGFRHLSDVPVQRLSKVALLNYVMQAVFVFSFSPAKASVGCLILRFLCRHSHKRRWLIWGVIILTVVVNSIDCILTFAQCSPPRALWDHSIEANCWDPRVQEDFALFQACKMLGVKLAPCY